MHQIQFSDGRLWWGLNLVGSNLIWLYLVLGYPWWGALPVVVCQWWLSPWRQADLRRLLWLAPTGYAIDALWQWLSILQFEPQGLLPPPWLALLWVSFALGLPHALFFLRRSSWLTLASVGLLVPSTYLAGVALGAASLPLGPLVAYPAMAAGWLVLLPVAFKLEQRWSERPHQT